MSLQCSCFFVGHLCCCSLRWRSDLAAFPPRCQSFLHWTARRRRRWHSLCVFSFGAGFLCWSLQANSVVLPHHHHIILLLILEINVIIIITRLKRAGLWSQDTVEAGTFQGVLIENFSTSQIGPSHRRSQLTLGAFFNIVQKAVDDSIPSF